MAKPFDTSLKELFDVYPHDLQSLLRLDQGKPLALLPTNLTANVDTDMVLGLGQPLDGVVDINFQVEWDDETPYRLLCYNALLYREWRQPVHSVIVMLRSRGNDLRMDEGIRYALFPERGRMQFALEIIRLWERPVEEMLTGGLGLLPLATIAAMPAGVSREEAFPEILRRIEERLQPIPSTEKTDRLLNWTYRLSGLHFTPREVQAMFSRSSTMWNDVLKHSLTYQGTLEDGRVDQARKTILRVGTKKLGAPDERSKMLVSGVEELATLDAIADRLLTATSWQDLLEPVNA